MSSKDQKNKGKQGDMKKPPMRSGFNLFFTLLFVVFMAMVMLTMFDENPLGSTREISPISFLKLLYTCRITHLEVYGFEKVEGEYIVDPDRSGDVYSPPPDTDSDPGQDPNIGTFVMELSQEGLQKLSPDYYRFVAKKVEKGDPAVFVDDVENDNLLVHSYYTITTDTPLIRSIDEQKKPQLIGDPIVGSDPGTELFVDMVDSSGQTRFKRYSFKAGSGVVNPAHNLKTVLAAIRKNFPTAEFQNHPVQNESGLNFNKPNTFWATVLYPLIPWVLIIGLLWFFIIRQMRSPGGGGGVLSFGRSKAMLVNKEKTDVTFADVAGIEEAKEEVTEIIEFLKNPAKFSRLGGRIPRGVLLVGAPGTGKTLLAKAIAGEADVPFFSISGSDFVEMFVGVGASRVRDLFRQARESSPCLIFLDEIDAVGRKRGAGLGGGHDEREQTLNAILVEMDGFDTDVGIILLAATNRPDVLDPALLRPGRFDREIVIDLPDLRGREGILKVHCRKVKVAESVELSVLARGTPGFSGAELASVVNEAALLATMKDRSAVEMNDFEEARDKVRWGRQKKSRIMDKEDKRITAIHESGHALVAHTVPAAEPVHKVTIIPRGAALGATMILPEKDRYHYRKKELMARIQVLYAGRIAEEKFCGDISGGAQNDIETASETARVMVCQLGMSEKVGPVSYGEKSGPVFLGQELVRSKTHSDEVARQIDTEVKAIIDTCYQESEKIIEGKRKELEKIAEALLKYETITGSEVKAIIDGKPLEEIDFEYALPPPSPADEPEVNSSKAKKETSPESEIDPDGLPAEGEPAY